MKRKKGRTDESSGTLGKLKILLIKVFRHDVLAGHGDLNKSEKKKTGAFRKGLLQGATSVLTKRCEFWKI